MLEEAVRYIGENEQTAASTNKLKLPSWMRLWIQGSLCIAD